MVTASIVFAALAWWAVSVWYTLRARWWKLPLGRNAEFINIALALLLSRLAAVRLWPEIKEIEWATVLLYLALAVFALQRIRHIERAQRFQTRLIIDTKE